MYCGKISKMISKSWCFIIVGTIITFKSVICDYCDADPDIPVEAIYQCYEAPSKHECKSNITNFRTDEPKDGMVDVKFDYEPNCYYVLELKRWHDIKNDKSCLANQMSPTEASEYTNYKYSEVSKNYGNLPKCINNKEKMGTGIIKLKYLTTGCYYMQLKKYGHDEVEVNRAVLKRNYFELPKTKLNYSEFDYKSDWDYISNEDVTIFEVQHPFVKKLPNLVLRIEGNKNFECTKPSCGRFEFSPSRDNSETVKYNLCNGNDKDTGISCEVTGEKLVCKIKYLDKGNYSISYEFKNLIQCQNYWHQFFEHCGGQGEPVVAPRISTPPPPVDNNYNPILWILLSLGCIAILLIVVLVICRKYARQEDGSSNLPPLIPYLEERSFDGQSQILLLYAKDADIVMETMASFRRALEAKGFEVYDVYDTRQQESIDELGEKWITDQLSNKYMKTVIVQTYCGQILSNSTLPAESLYREPTCYDSLFPYALSLIRDRKDSNCYTKLFIANMGFDKMDYTEFTFLNPSTRFGLPDNFFKLIRDLQDNCTIDMCENENELNEFKFKYKEMKSYIEDPNYLSEILKVSISHINNKFETEETFKKEINV